MNGTQGDSLSVNTETGVWTDFASEHGGSDPVSLYAAVYGIDSQGEACRRLAEELGLPNGIPTFSPKPKPKEDWHQIFPAPEEPPAKINGGRRLGVEAERLPLRLRQLQLDLIRAVVAGVCQ